MTAAECRFWLAVSVICAAVAGVFCLAYLTTNGPLLLALVAFGLCALFAGLAQHLSNRAKETN